MRRSNQWRRTCLLERIEKLAPGYDPAHVMAWLMEGSPIVENRSPDELRQGVRIACAVIDLVGLEDSDRIAEKFGLHPRRRKS